jgi:L-seryl-tRNA(Ser) seleniumtransferase
MRRALPPNVFLKTLPGFSQVGGGTFPLLEIPTSLIAVTVAGLSAQQLEQKLRTSPLPVIGRISQDAFLLDLRTVTDKDILEVISALQAIAA